MAWNTFARTPSPRVAARTVDLCPVVGRPGLSFAHSAPMPIGSDIRLLRMTYRHPRAVFRSLEPPFKSLAPGRRPSALPIFRPSAIRPSGRTSGSLRLCSIGQRRTAVRRRRRIGFIPPASIRQLRLWLAVLAPGTQRFARRDSELAAQADRLSTRRTKLARC